MVQIGKWVITNLLSLRSLSHTIRVWRVIAFLELPRREDWTTYRSQHLYRRKARRRWIFLPVSLRFFKTRSETETKFLLLLSRIFRPRSQAQEWWTQATPWIEGVSFVVSINTNWNSWDCFEVRLTILPMSLTVHCLQRQQAVNRRLRVKIRSRYSDTLERWY